MTPAAERRARGGWALRAPALALSLGVLCTSAGAAPAGAGRFRVESHLTPRVVAVDGLVLFTIEVEGPGFQQPRLRPRFELENLEIVGPVEPSQGIAFGTAGAGWRYSWTWRLRPLAEGHAAVVGVYLLVGDREVELAPQRLEVRSGAVPSSAAPGAPSWRDGRERPASPRSRLEELLSRGLGRYRPAPAPRSEERHGLFLRAVAFPERPYVGQRVLYTLYLYTRVPVRAMEPESLPTFRGLWARPVESALTDQERVEWEGELYNRVPLLRKELFALGSATHVIEPVRLRFVVDEIEPGRMFLAPVRTPVELVRESNPVELDARPLPPAGPGTASAFGGTVGELALAAAFEPLEVAVDQGATLTVTAAGEGHLEAMAAPRVVAPAEVEVIGPQSAPSPDGEAGGTTRSWSYLLIPRSPGSWRIPAIEVPYFDPGAGEYRLARAVLPALVARPPLGGATAASGIARIEPERGADRSARARTQRWALSGAVALPLLAALLLVLARRRGGSLRGAAPEAIEELGRTLDVALHEERPRRAAAAIEAAWRAFLGDRHALPASVLSARWPDELLKRGAPREACRELGGLLDDLHFLRFAPELSTTAALARELVERSLRLAPELDC
ncbi:MAG TPA: BatD family protein [Thermoanaerobaculia bacterium]|nr:BatD family protein [Thermoanaerobaculia bacterium]